MGNNTQERGQLILPSAAVVTVRNALVEATNKQRAQWLEVATKVYNNLREPGNAEDRNILSSLLRNKPVPGYFHGLSSFLEKKIKQVQAVGSVNWSHSRWDQGRDNSEFEQLWQVENLLFTRPEKAGDPRKIRAPKKKDMAPLPQSKTWSFSNDDCSIHIDPEKRTLEWYVSENKDAVECAWNSPLGKALKAALKNVKWTRGTGGVFNYSDEYGRDAAMEHGYDAVSISHAFGPLGDDEMDSRSGFSQRKRQPKKSY